MSYNGSGTFQINTSGQPVVAGTVISSTAFNALTADLATGLSTAITKDGQTTTTARIPFAAGINSSSTTDSSSTSTGSIITAGGIGAAKALFVGTTANVAGAATLGSTLTYGGVTLTNAVTGTGKMVLDTSPTLVTPNLGTPASGILTNCTGINYDGFKNRIINGGMVIDQRNAGASVTPADQQYTLDRWVYVADQASKCTIEQTISGVSAPAGFSDYLGVTSTATTTITTSQVFAVVQRIEGYNMADFAWGTASAATITLSFWVRSSLTGTFGGALRNNAGDYNYPFSYTISSANTWEQKSVTITGATSGTWLTTNGRAMQVVFGLGAGATVSGTAGAWSTSNFWSATGATQVLATNGATFYLTGVQLEKGSTATSFDYRPYGTELSLCQRYFYKIVGNTSPSAGIGSGFSTASTTARVYVKYPVNTRTAPTVSFGGTFFAYDGGLGTVTSLAINAGDQSCSLDLTCSGGGLTAFRGNVANLSSASTDFLQFSAEL